MRGDAQLRALEARLGAEAPPGVASLAPAHVQDLLAAIDEARHRQATELQVAGDKAFAHVPRVLRGPIRRIMG